MPMLKAISWPPFLTGFLILAMSGCGTTQFLLEEKKMKIDKGITSITPLFVPFGVSFHFEVFEDKRKEYLGTLGTTGTGLFNKEAKILSKRSIGKIASEFFSKGFEARGVMIQPKEKATHIFRSNIKELWIRERRGTRTENGFCRVKIDSAVFKKNVKKPIWYGISWAEFRSRPMTDVTGEIPVTLASCLNLAIEQIISGKEFRYATGIRPH